MLRQSYKTPRHFPFCVSGSLDDCKESYAFASPDKTAKPDVFLTSVEVSGALFSRMASSPSEQTASPIIFAAAQQTAPVVILEVSPVEILLAITANASAVHCTSSPHYEDRLSGVEALHASPHHG